MKTGALSLRHAADLDAFLAWVASANIQYGGWRANGLSLRDHCLGQMANNPQSVFVTDPPGRSFAIVSTSLIKQSTAFAPVNSLSHLKSYLVRCQVKT